MNEQEQRLLGLRTIKETKQNMSDELIKKYNMPTLTLDAVGKTVAEVFKATKDDDHLYIMFNDNSCLCISQSLFSGRGVIDKCCVVSCMIHFSMTSRVGILRLPRNGTAFKRKCIESQ